MNKKVISMVMQMPLVLVVVASFIGGIYAAAKKINGIGMAVPILLGVVIVLYFYGRRMENKSRREEIFG